MSARRSARNGGATRAAQHVQVDTPDTPDRPARQAATWRFELVVQAAAPGQPWRATLVSDDGARRIEFASALMLARHLARETGAEAPRGLR